MRDEFISIVVAVRVNGERSEGCDQRVVGVSTNVDGCGQDHGIATRIPSAARHRVSVNHKWIRVPSPGRLMLPSHNRRISIHVVVSAQFTYQCCPLCHTTLSSSGISLISSSSSSLPCECVSDSCRGRASSYSARACIACLCASAKQSMEAVSEIAMIISVHKSERGYRTTTWHSRSVHLLPYPVLCASWPSSAVTKGAKSVAPSSTVRSLETSDQKAGIVSIVGDWAKSTQVVHESSKVDCNY